MCELIDEVNVTVEFIGIFCRVYMLCAYCSQLLPVELTTISHFGLQFTYTMMSFHRFKAKQRTVIDTA